MGHAGVGQQGGVGWVIQGWDRSCRVSHSWVGWVGHVGVGESYRGGVEWVIQECGVLQGGLGHAGVGWGGSCRWDGSCRGGVGGSCRGRWVMQGWNGVTSR